MEYDVSLLGGYSDEEEISQDITEMLLVVMQVVKIVMVMIIDVIVMVMIVDVIVMVMIIDVIVWALKSNV